jgi:hypothetical protein
MLEKSNLRSLFVAARGMLTVATGTLFLTACGGDQDGVASRPNVFNSPVETPNGEACNLATERVADLASTIQSGTTGL